MKNIRSVQIILLMSLVVLLLSACGGLQAQETFTIGVVNYVEILTPAYEGFKEGMTELGYVEGENIIYIYNGVVGAEPEAVDAEIESLLAQDVDVLVTIGNLATIQAKQATAGADMPIVFAAVSSPVEEGLVESLSHPGGNLTGTMTGTETAKALEWLVRITPDAQKIYVPYTPEAEVSVLYLNIVGDIAAQLEVEIVPGEVHSIEEAVTAIEDLPEDIDAIFRIPMPSLPVTGQLNQAAINRGLPLGAFIPLDEATLIVLTTDLVGVGKQTARLAHQVIEGVKPADLPVETGEVYMTINLETADAIGLEIPDDVLLQANNIIRGDE